MLLLTPGMIPPPPPPPPGPPQADSCAIISSTCNACWLVDVDGIFCLGSLPGREWRRDGDPLGWV